MLPTTNKARTSGLLPPPSRKERQLICQKLSDVRTLCSRRTVAPYRHTILCSYGIGIRTSSEPRSRSFKPRVHCCEAGRLKVRKRFVVYYSHRRLAMNQEIRVLHREKRTREAYNRCDKTDRLASMTRHSSLQLQLQLQLFFYTPRRGETAARRTISPSVAGNGTARRPFLKNRRTRMARDFIRVKSTRSPPFVKESECLLLDDNAG